MLTKEIKKLSNLDYSWTPHTKTLRHKETSCKVFFDKLSLSFVLFFAWYLTLIKSILESLCLRVSEFFRLNRILLVECQIRFLPRISTNLCGFATWREIRRMIIHIIIPRRHSAFPAVEHAFLGWTIFLIGFKIYLNILIDFSIIIVCQRWGFQRRVQLKTLFSYWVVAGVPNHYLRSTAWWMGTINVLTERFIGSVD